MDAVVESGVMKRSGDRALPRTVSDAVPRQFLAGDAMRGIGALCVVLFHAAQLSLYWKHAPGYEVTNESAHVLRPVAGVFAAPLSVLRGAIYIFFALSGYLLTRAFLASYTIGTALPSISRYARNRLLRIVPAFWVITTVYMVWQHGWGRSGGVGGVLAVYAFAQNYHFTDAAMLMGQAWTVDIEITFYVLIPIAALAALWITRRVRSTPRQRVWALLIVLLTAYVISLYLNHRGGIRLWNTFNLSQMLFTFLPGVALATIEPFAAPRLRAASSGRLWGWAALGAALVLLVVFVLLPPWRHSPRIFCVSLGFAGLFAAPLLYQWATGGCWRALDNSATRWLGDRSYGIYLIHLTLMNRVLAWIGHGYSLGATFWLTLLITTSIALVGADLSWRLVERPALQRRLRWRRAEFGTAAPMVQRL